MYTLHYLPQLQNHNPKLLCLSSRDSICKFTLCTRNICKKIQINLSLSLCIIYKWKIATPITFSQMRMPAKPTIANRPFHRSAWAVKGPFLHVQQHVSIPPQNEKRFYVIGNTNELCTEANERFMWVNFEKIWCVLTFDYRETRHWREGWVMPKW